MQPLNPKKPIVDTSVASDCNSMVDSQLSSKSGKFFSPRCSWLAKGLAGCTIRQKITLGYILTLGLALLGTTAGIAIGSYYQQKGLQRVVSANQNKDLLTSLRIATLEVPFYRQNLNPIVQHTPEEFELQKSLFMEHVTKVQRQLLELKNSKYTIEGLEPLLNQYNGVVEAYIQELEILWSQMARLGTEQEDVFDAQQFIWSFADQPAVQKFYRFTEALQSPIVKAQEQQREAEIALEKAAFVRRWSLMVSMLLSLLMGILFALYISRAIARPLEAVTLVSQRMSKESNFDLQVPVTTRDEIGVLATSFNELISRVKRLLAELEAEKQTQLIQSEKMASLGRMLAGVAHELNNPINFIYGNITPAEEYIQDILSLLETYETEIPNPPSAVREQAEKIEIDFLKEDLLKLLQSMKVGADRARAIVLSLKNFSRLDDVTPHLLDLHECLDSTLLILHNRIKKDINIVLKYGNIPPIEGYMGLLYQVFMNILSNAVDALEENQAIDGNKEKNILITTERLGNDWVVVRIADNGSGIDPANQSKIFENFFTTKPRGIGTGLGLAISRQIVEEKHGGKVICSSELGRGTEFAIELPIKHSSSSTVS